MNTTPFPAPSANFSAKTVSSLPRRVRFRSVVSSSTNVRSTSYLSPQSMASCSTLYEILGINAAASGEEIKAAYRRLVRVCHPDVAPVGRKESSVEEFMKIHNAYRTLSNPEKRAAYDRNLFQRGRPLATTSSGVSGYRGRRWETDQCW